MAKKSLVEQYAQTKLERILPYDCYSDEYKLVVKSEIDDAVRLYTHDMITMDDAMRSIANV